MSRTFSIVRRKPGIVDLTIRRRDGVKSYQMFAAANFDSGSFIQFATLPADGLQSPTVVNAAAQGSFRGLTRFLFNPADYTLLVAGMVDTKPFFIRIKQIAVDGTVGPFEAVQAVYPSFQGTSYAPIILAGVAPGGATQADSLEIQLPCTVKSFDLQNLSSTVMFVAFEPDGPEFQVGANGGYSTDVGLVSSLFVRGSGATAGFQFTGVPPYNLGR